VTEVLALPYPHWNLPEIAPDDFNYRFGASVLTRFVLAHTVADVLRELVQNEYDAGGAILRVLFAAEALQVTGSGRTIDSKGWKRLSVLLGTGQVGGDDEAIEEKTNGIGSMNNGLRSAFLIGDRIYVRSGGRMTVLDRVAGAMSKPRIDPGSANQPGASIVVPYRQKAADQLPAFDIGYERAALESIGRALAPTLIKLALPSSPKSLRTVVVGSERLGIELEWYQSVRRLESTTPALERRVRFRRKGMPSSEVPTTITEIEFGTTLVPPADIRETNIPAYFKAPGGRIRVAVSFPMRGRSLDRSTAGIFYYPLGARQTRTGFPFSVCAPFKMDNERSQLVPAANSPWNAWLIRAAADLVGQVLRSDLWPRFGAAAYLAVAPDPDANGSATVPELPAEVTKRLRESACWPSRATTGTKRMRRPVFRKLESLAVPETDAISDLLTEALDGEVVLHADVSRRAELRRLASSLGAPMFTLNSLVRLRCGAPDGDGGLKTPSPDGESKLLYTHFPGPLTVLARQVQFGKALDAEQARLQAAHKADLRHSATTLTAAETLAAPDDLAVVDEGIAEIVPPEGRLHPALRDCKVLTGLCKRFDASSWAVDVASRLSTGEASEAEREALRRYLLGNPQLSERAWKILRRSPVLTDHCGDWVPPASMVRRGAPGVKNLEPALHLTRPEYESNAVLVSHLRFRTSVTGEDLVELARMVATYAVPPALLRAAFSRLPSLLTARVAERLYDTACLETATGELVAPADGYVRNERIANVLGEDAPYAVLLSGNLLSRLRCRTEPRFDDIVARLEALRDAGEIPAKPEVMYAALCAAGRAERGRAPGELRSQPILWTGSMWAAPDDCLVGEHRKVFLASVPVLNGGQRDTYLALGAHARPQVKHWRALLRWVSNNHPAGTRIPRKVVDALRRAYGRLEALPEGLPGTTRCLLDDLGQLHAVDDLARGRLLINDDPVLADVIRSSGIDVAFADTYEPRFQRLLTATGAKPLSAVVKLDRTIMGHDVECKQALRAPTLLRRLKEPHLASALAALATVLCGADSRRTGARISRRLQKLERVAFTDTITRHYRVGRATVPVPRDFEVQADRLVLTPVRTAKALDQLVARAVAVLVDPTPRGEQALMDPVYFLLGCRSTGELRRQLEQRRIPWRPDPHLEWAVDDDDDDDDDESDAVAEALAKAMAEGALRRRNGSTQHRQNGNGGTPPDPDPVRKPRPPLPSLDDVVEYEVTATEWSRPRTNGSSGGGGGGGSNWTPRTPEEEQADRELGRHGELIVLRRERRRIAALGLNPDQVIWTADIDPAADHDIQSVDADGEPIFIEVKSTTGRDGRFSWPRSEFRRALAARGRYVFYRIYEAHTLTPPFREVRDPIALLEAGELLVDLESLAVDLGPATTTAPVIAAVALGE